MREEPLQYVTRLVRLHDLFRARLLPIFLAVLSRTTLPWPLGTASLGQDVLELVHVSSLQLLVLDNATRKEHIQTWVFGQLKILIQSIPLCETLAFDRCSRILAVPNEEHVFVLGGFFFSIGTRFLVVPSLGQQEAVKTVFFQSLFIRRERVLQPTRRQVFA